MRCEASARIRLEAFCRIRRQPAASRNEADRRETAPWPTKKAHRTPPTSDRPQAYA